MTSPTIDTFSTDFIAQYGDAFDELVRLGSIAAQNKVNGKNSAKEDDKANKLFTVLSALSSPGLTAKETEALEYCLISLNESLTIPTVEAFSSDFIAQYGDAFDELIRLGTIAAQNKVNGKTIKNEEDKGSRLFIILSALSSPDLTTKEIEALEYCLRDLNESLTVPTAQELIPSLTYPIQYKLIAKPGIFRLTGKDVDFHRASVMPASNGSISLTGVEVNLVFAVFGGGVSYSMSANFGAFALTGQDVALTADLLVVGAEASLVTESNPMQEFSVEYDNGGGSPETITLFSVGSTSSVELRYNSSVMATVRKTTNGGIAQGSGSITFILNGSTQSTHTINFGENLSSGISYTFTGLSPDDVLRVEVVETDIA